MLSGITFGDRSALEREEQQAAQAAQAAAAAAAAARKKVKKKLKKVMFKMCTARSLEVVKCFMLHVADTVLLQQMCCTCAATHLLLTTHMHAIDCSQEKKKHKKEKSKKQKDRGHGSSGKQGQQSLRLSAFNV
jgi:hypothetical protein